MAWGRGLRIAVPHHQPPTTRSQEGRAENTGNSTKRISEAASDSWNNTDKLPISDALSFVRTPQCQEV